MQDFVQLPRQIKSDFIDGILNENEYDVLVWIYLSTNPYNGRYEMSYREISEEIFKKISNDNARKIICKLRLHKYIWFDNHRGRGGKFTIYPSNFALTSGRIQKYEDHAVHKSKPIDKIMPEQLPAKVQHNLNVQNHNLRKEKKLLVDKMTAQHEKEITSAYNDNENNNEFNKNFSEVNGPPIKALDQLRDVVKNLKRTNI